MKRFLSLLGFVAVFPFFLSRRSRVLRSTWINAKPAEVFPFINDLRNWPLWTEWSQNEEIEVRYEGPNFGEGAVQHWTTSRMVGKLTIIASVLDKRVSYDLEMDGGHHTIQGAIELEPVGQGTRITWACWWIGGVNPYTRYLDIAMRWWINRDFEAGLENLKKLTAHRRQEQPAEAV